MNKIKWKGFLLTTSDSEIEVIHDTLTYDWDKKCFVFTTTINISLKFQKAFKVSSIVYMRKD
ncbi:hypothetical protein [Enterococcus sp. AZ162]|uniref:hypothetical protein n=1 Tax=unclassified Enterococcus TaxID=2608891 RepID=UPI003F6867E1